MGNILKFNVEKLCLNLKDEDFEKLEDLGFIDVIKDYNNPEIPYMELKDSLILRWRRRFLNKLPLC